MSSTSEESLTASKPQQREGPRRPPEIDKYVDTFLSTVCDTKRRYILEILAMPGDKDTHLQPQMPEMRSGDIAKAIGLSAATTSEHLRQLVTIGLITSRRAGNTVYYRLCNHELVEAFDKLLVALDKAYSERPGSV
jgi:DNA-binding transcriptional ArsR family regulator